MSETVHLLNEGTGRAGIEVRAFADERGPMLQFVAVDSRAAVFVEATYDEVERLEGALTAWLWDRAASKLLHDREVKHGNG